MTALACVIGDMDLVRPLGLAGIGCAVVAPPGSPPTHSRFVHAVIPWQAGRDDEAALLAALLRFGAAQPERPVLYVQDDAGLLMASRHRESLSRVFRLPLARPDLVEDLVDKSRFARLAARVGLPVPRTRHISPGAWAEPDLRCPVVIKPVTRGPAWDALAAGAKAMQAATAEECRGLLARLAGSGVEVLVQEMIPGPETRIESHHLLVDARGAVVAEFTGRKIRTWPGAMGHSTALEITEAPDVAALGREAVRRIGLTGVAKLDVKRAPDGRLHLLEINPRFNLWHHLGAVAGVNLPALVHAGLCGLALPPLAPARPGTAWCRPREDWRAARAEGVGPLRWARWMLGCRANASFDPRDPMPFLHGAVWNGLRRAGRGRLAGPSRLGEAG